MSTTSTSRKSTSDKAEYYKSVIVCCDGTGQAASHGQAVVPTNVARFAQALEVSSEWWSPDGKKMETQQVVLYQTGVGTDAGLSGGGALFGEAFGRGLDMHVLEAYHFFAHNFEEGDTIFVFGFSRGAFTARAIASFIVNVGLLKKEFIQFLPPIYQEYKKHFRPKKRAKWHHWLEKNHELLLPMMHKTVRIPVVGLWDTVGSLGIPESRFSKYFKWTHLRSFVNEKYAFLDSSITPRSGDTNFGLRIEHAYQALALDERRISFSPTLLCTTCPPQTSEEKLSAIERQEHYPIVEQCWFPGGHSDIGGGHPRGYNDISDFALAWMVDKCLPFLQFNDEFLDKAFTTPSLGFVRRSTMVAVETLKDKHNGEPIKPNRWGLSKLHDSYKGLQWMIVGSRTRKPGEYFLGTTDEQGKPYRTNEYFHPSIRARLTENLYAAQDPMWTKYNPPALHGFRLKRRPSSPHSDGSSSTDASITHVERDDPTTGGWVFTKTIQLKNPTRVVTVEIPEFEIQWNKKEWENQPPEKERDKNAYRTGWEMGLFDDDARRLLHDERADELINSAMERMEKKWWVRLFEGKGEEKTEKT